MAEEDGRGVTGVPPPLRISPRGGGDSHSLHPGGAGSPSPSCHTTLWFTSQEIALKDRTSSNPLHPLPHGQNVQHDQSSNFGTFHGEPSTVLQSTVLQSTPVYAEYEKAKTEVDWRMHIQNVPRQNVPGTECPKGQNVPGT